MSAFFLSMFTLGLVTSLHCVSMCGPLVVSYALKGEEDGPWHRKVLPNVAYQGAKITSYVGVGLLLGAIGSAFNLDAARPWVMLAAGVFMIVIGLGMTGRVPWAARLTPRPPKFLVDALTRVRRRANAEAGEGVSSLATPVMLGLLTGLFPCAPLQSAQLAAAASGSAVYGAAAMLAFGVGTMPLMLAFGTASSLIPKQAKQKVMLVLAAVVMVFGLVYINRGLTLVGSPVNFNTVRQAVVGTPAATAPTEYETDADGYVVVPLAIQNTQFVPDSLQLPADKPVRLVVDRQEDNACSDQIAIPQLGVLEELTPFGTTTVELPPAAAGSYTLTCGMGMMSGQILAGAAGAAAASMSWVWLMVALLAGGGALYVAARGRVRPAADAAPGRPEGQASRV